MNTDLRERQDDFIRTMSDFDNWSERFNFLIDMGNFLDALCPDYLLPYKIEFCQSRTYFMAKSVNGIINVSGWSNAGTIRGLIASITDIFSGVPVDELSITVIDFHTKTNLICNLTYLRKESLLEMIRRINVLSGNK